ncbi:hypothetical protein GCM10027443_13810 [Pontibacter brevis]
MKKPVVSIIVPLFNRYTLIDETICSVLSQSTTNWELIIVDDGSTDGSYEKALKWQEYFPHYINVIKRERLPKGAPTCRNIGIANAIGDYLIFLDSDDLLAPYAVANRVDLLQKEGPEIDMLVTPCFIFNDKMGDTNLLWNCDDISFSDLDRFLMVDVPWQTTSVTWKAESLRRIGSWDENLLSFQDWELGIRAILNGLRFKKNGEPDCFWRKDTKDRPSIGRDAISKPHLRSHLNLFKKIADSLQSSKNLNPQRQKLLTHLYLWLFYQWKKVDKIEALISLNKLLLRLHLEYSIFFKLNIIALLSFYKFTSRLKYAIINRFHVRKYVFLPKKSTLHVVEYVTEA